MTEGIEAGTRIEIIIEIDDPDVDTVKHQGTFVDWVGEGVLWTQDDGATVFTPSRHLWSVATTRTQANR